MKLGALAFASLVALAGLVGCQHADEGKPGTSDPAAATASATATQVVAQPSEGAGHSCGGMCGGSCGGMDSCGGQCGMDEGAGKVAAAAPEAAKTLPADAVWTSMHVTGMHCGGCARRIKHALAQVDGVYGVEVDLSTATVKVATAKDRDARGIAAPPIDALGYHVEN